MILYHSCKTAEPPDKPQSTKSEILVSANPPSIKARTIQERALCLSCYISISVKDKALETGCFDSCQFLHEWNSEGF